jgi:uncharacterized membrane protein (DUF485 family)
MELKYLLTSYNIDAALYASYLFGNLVEQLWNFAWPAALAILHRSLLPVAIVGFFTKVLAIVLNLREIFHIYTQ